MHPHAHPRHASRRRAAARASARPRARSSSGPRSPSRSSPSRSPCTCPRTSTTARARVRQSFQFEQNLPWIASPRHPLPRRRRRPLHVARRPHRPARARSACSSPGTPSTRARSSSTRSSCSSRSRCSASSSRSTSSSTTPSGSSRSSPWRCSSPSSAAPSNRRRAAIKLLPLRLHPLRAAAGRHPLALRPHRHLRPPRRSPLSPRTHGISANSAALWLASLAFLVRLRRQGPGLPAARLAGRTRSCEAPTAAVMVLAGKIGLYSILRFSFGIFPDRIPSHRTA